MLSEDKKFPAKLAVQVIVFGYVAKWIPVLKDHPCRFGELFQESQVCRIESGSFRSLSRHRASLAAFLSPFHLASRDFVGVDKGVDTVMWQRSSVAIHAVPQSGALESVLSAIFVVGLSTKLLFILSNFSGFGLGCGHVPADKSYTCQ